MEKIKQIIQKAEESSNTDKGKDILVVIIIILVGTGSFGLGRLSKSSKQPDIEFEYSIQEASVIQSLETSNSANFEPRANPSTANANHASSTNFFASNRGSKYYPAKCSAGKNIKEENRVYFESSTEAENAGYELSASCR